MLKPYNFANAEFNDRLQYGEDIGFVKSVSPTHIVVEWSDGRGPVVYERGWSDHGFTIAPLCRLGGTPLYKGDTIYTEDGKYTIIGGDDKFIRLHDMSLCDLRDGELNSAEFSIVPRQLTINGIPVSAPLNKAPKMGSLVYLPSLTALNGSTTIRWENSVHHNRLLNEGLMFNSPNKANAFTGALLRYKR